MKGFVKTPRGSLDDPLLRPRGPYTPFEASWWLREQAAINVRRATIGNRTTRLKRGQLSYSFRFLGQKWGWDTAKVWRFLNGLRNAGRINYETARETGQTLVTICDYDSFGDTPPCSETPGETPDETPTATAGETKKEENPSDLKKKGEEARFARKTRARESGDAIKLEFEEWWELYPHKVGKPAALSEYRTALAEATQQKLVEGLQRYIAANTPPLRQWLNPANWLKQKRWVDQPAPHPVNGNNGARYERRRRSATEDHFAGFAAAAEDDPGSGRTAA
jgi:hypothetical protein